jgi:hypothetical protein
MTLKKRPPSGASSVGNAPEIRSESTVLQRRGSTDRLRQYSVEPAKFVCNAGPASSNGTGQDGILA